MSALWRLNLLVALFFALVAMVCLAVLLRQASHDVQRELDAAAAVVAYLGEMAERDPATLRPELTDSLRHVRVRWLSPGQPATDGGDTLLTDWLGTWLYPAELAAPSELQLPGGERLQISVDPSDEVEEVRDSLLQLLALSEWPCCFACWRSVGRCAPACACWQSCSAHWCVSPTGGSIPGCRPIASPRRANSPSASITWLPRWKTRERITTG